MVADRNTYFVEDVNRHFIEPARRFTDVPFILGGSGYTIFPRKILDYTGADYGIAGEGEETLLALLQNLERERIQAKSQMFMQKMARVPDLSG